MDEYRQILLRTFRAFSRLCEREGLRWWLAFGSAIGAVREGGVIPWDDDIDVFMPREDYKRFLTLSSDSYKILDISTSDKDLPFAYAKFMDAGSSIWEQRRYPLVIGVFIDVFPLDDAGPDPETVRREYRGAFLDYVRSFRRNTSFSLSTALDLLLYRPRHAALRRRFLEIYRRASSQGDSGSYAVWCTNSEYRGITFPKEWFASTAMVPFEGGMAPVPSGNDSLLTLLYGDWRTPPPQSDRRSFHHHYRIDLHRPLDSKDRWV
ncbi:MAG: LicD family protein [Bacteroidales bacterium]|nr:LicD family protein [Bacteroidales bacterium]